MVRTDCHTFDPLFSPPTSAQNPCFYQKLSPKDVLFFSLSRILEIFLSKTPNRLEFEKKVPKCPLFLWFCDWKTPYFLPCIHIVCLRGMLLPQRRSEAGKFCILETESCNLVNTFRCKFFSSTGSTDPIVHYGWISLEGRDNIQAIITLVKHGRGYILQPPSINLHTWLSKQMPSVPEDVRAEAF